MSLMPLDHWPSLLDHWPSMLRVTPTLCRRRHGFPPGLVAKRGGM
eukprot:NODE_10640_length_300_cov_214.383673.p3 GENE.NODE_10640_length_300_cov_214.383673~~NODE_10640_length_300_cov_214.383673.p3  ORF type:complete len:54 (+),score=8.19 NODE_10640_length_300_cov_214.383673:28-162(+)